MIRELGRIRMVDRDHTELGAALLSEMHQIRAYNGQIADALEASNKRWQRRQDEIKAEAYVAGYLDRADGNPPTEPV